MQIIKTSRATVEETITERQYGIDNLGNYIKKLKQNIQVFEDAIEKEESEIKRTREMIAVLTKDKKALSKTLPKK